jgi:hypothetical protein
MEMLKTQKPQTDEYVINKLIYQLEGNKCVLRWEWPPNLQYVYIYRSNSDESVDFASINSLKLRLYTRGEYKSTNGYHDQLVGHSGPLIYKVFACIKETNESIIIEQDNSDNTVRINSGKKPIYYLIREKPRWFGGDKKVHIQLRTDVPISGNTLRFVKKRGTYPASMKDGIVYPIPYDLEPGSRKLKPIVIKKNEYIRLFVSDSNNYNNIYELIPE